MKNNAGIVLMYNCSGDQFSKLKQIFAMLRLRMRLVEPDRYHIPLEELAQGVSAPGGATAPSETAEPLEEPMLVFCNVGQALLDKVLEVIRLSKLPPIPLKAVLTESNRTWNSLELHTELCKERAAIAARKEKKT